MPPRIRQSLLRPVPTRGAIKSKLQIVKTLDLISLSSMKWRRVALLAFAYRHISVRITPKARKQDEPNSLPVKVKTISDWIHVKLRENGMSPFHLGAKMGIATSLVNAWKDGLAGPQNRQMREMVAIFGTYRHGRSM